METRLRQRNSGKQQSEKTVSKEKKKLKKTSFVKYIIFCVLILLVVFLIGIPVAVKTLPIFRQSLLFMNIINFQYFMNISNPSEYGLDCTINFKIYIEDSIELGAWHIFPGNYTNCDNLTSDFVLADNRPVFLYFHGNGGTRGGWHRVNLYKKLRKELDSSVITIDYRGYADSTYLLPSVTTVTEDAVNAYTWLSLKVSKDRIIVWGHSLGTAISVLALSKLDLRDRPNKLILESPFSSTYDEISSHPLSNLFIFLPYFNYMIASPFKDKDTNFNTESIIGSLDIPILILHAYDDKIVPISQGQKLFKKLLQISKDKKTQPKMVSFNKVKGYGHKYIWKDPGLADIIRDFINEKT